MVAVLLVALLVGAAIAIVDRQLAQRAWGLQHFQQVELVGLRQSLIFYHHLIALLALLELAHDILHLLFELVCYLWLGICRYLFVNRCS